MNHYPVSAQYAPLSGLAGMRSGRVVKVALPKPEPALRTVYAVPLQEQILNAVRMIDGPTLKQIKYACKGVNPQNVSRAVSRMCDKLILRMDGEHLRYRYYEMGRQ